jgi:hypothetical protein
MKPDSQMTKFTETILCVLNILNRKRITSNLYFSQLYIMPGKTINRALSCSAQGMYISRKVASFVVNCMNCLLIY